ncbi:MAG: HEPN domain-containing protein [Bdellovibrionota bacterium]
MSPKQQEKLFKKEYAIELMKIAEGDLETAEVITSCKKGRAENGFFMAQQAIEKALKAVLIAQGIKVPLVHDLGVLLAKLPEKLEPPFGYELSELNQFAAARRYEEGTYEVSFEDLSEVITKSKEMLTWAKNYL